MPTSWRGSRPRAPSRPRDPDPHSGLHVLVTPSVSRLQFYHVLSSAALRRARALYRPGAARVAFEAALVVALAYTTAFMETLTICGFPYYRFHNRNRAYTVGSAFYGIYFLVSFPAFLRLDEDSRKPFTLAQTVTEAAAASMLVLCLLDFVRLWLGVPLFVPH